LKSRKTLQKTSHRFGILQVSFVKSWTVAVQLGDMAGRAVGLLDPALHDTAMLMIALTCDCFWRVFDTQRDVCISTVPGDLL